jgi:hypothetical protein
MTKVNIIIIASILFIACHNSSNKKVQQIDTLIPDDIPTSTWHYSSYVDSTIANKSIYKYSWTCASFAYEIDYDKRNPDSIQFTGYNESFKLSLSKKKEHIYWAGDTIQHWIITFSNDYSSLQIKEYMYPTYAKKADPEIYKFVKDNKRIGMLSEYFIKNILSGKYRNEEIEISLTDKFESTDGFSDKYKITGIDSASTYEVVINFWEMVPQMDLINLYRQDGSFYKQYNWSFNNDTLILRNVREIYKDGGFDGGIAEDVVFKIEKIN